MSRFKQPERYLGASSNHAAPTGSASSVVEDTAARRASPAERPIAALPARPLSAPAPESSIVARLGTLGLCVYLVAPMLQDLTTQAFHFKPYLNVAALAVVVPAFFASGMALRGLRLPTGRFWLAFLVFAALAIPFSYWPHGSATMMWGYFWRGYLLFFWLCAFAQDYAGCRTVMTANILAAVLLLVDCGLFGAVNDGGRLWIPDSNFFENSNDLALQLLVNVGFFTYLALQPRLLLRLAGIAGMAASGLFMLKTGSRGGLLACFVFVAILVLFSRQRIIWVAASVPALAIGLALMPSATLHRFTLVLLDPETAEASVEDMQSIGSQIERTQLMKTALKYTFTHPLFGVGPGEFMDAVWSDEHRQGKHPPALGTHNTYLEVSSECGLPAFFCYFAVVLGCILVNYRTYRRAQQNRALADPGRMAFCMFATSAGFAVNIFFHHLAYTGYLPLLAGMTACLSAVVPRENSRQRANPALPAGPPVLRSLPEALKASSGRPDRQRQLAR